MARLRYSDLYVKRALTAAALALDHLTKYAVYSRDDLVAGAIALDLLAARRPKATEAQDVAADLRELSMNPSCAESVPGRAKAARLAIIVRGIRAFVSPSPPSN